MNEANMLLLTATYSGVQPLGDLANRFGSGFMFGGQVEGHIWPGNWILGVESQFGFAGKVKENVLEFIQDADGNTVGRDLALSQAFLQQRLLGISIYGGKLFPVNANNKRSGIRCTVGAGYVWHWIKINDEMRSLPQIEGDYLDGYDRLTAGLITTQFIGYQHISLNRRIILFGGLDLMEGFTRSQRDYDFQNMSGDTSARFDMTIGIRIGWSISLYAGTQARDIYY